MRSCRGTIGIVTGPIKWNSRDGFLSTAASKAPKSNHSAIVPKYASLRRDVWPCRSEIVSDEVSSKDEETPFLTREIFDSISVPYLETSTSLKRTLEQRMIFAFITNLRSKRSSKARRLLEAEKPKASSIQS